MPMRKSSVLEGKNKQTKQTEFTETVQEAFKNFNNHWMKRTMKPVQAHCFAVVIAEMTELRSQDFNGHVAGNRAVSKTIKEGW